MLYCINAQYRRTTGITVLRYGVLFYSSLDLLRFLILVFHLEQKHEKRKRLFHYLQQTST